MGLFLPGYLEVCEESVKVGERGLKSGSSDASRFCTSRFWFTRPGGGAKDATFLPSSLALSVLLLHQPVFSNKGTDGAQGAFTLTLFIPILGLISPFREKDI